MSYRIIALPDFKRQAKKLSKKYRSLKSELSNLLEKLAENPTLGTSLGNNIFKIRLAVASKGKGKSGGVRVITYIQVNKHIIVLLSIYSKGEKDSISEKEIQELIDKYAK